MPVKRLIQVILLGLILAFLMGAEYLNGTAAAAAACADCNSPRQADAPLAERLAAAGEQLPLQATPTPGAAQRLAEAQSRHAALIVGAAIPVAVVILVVLLSYRRKARGH